jgi:tetratricopeptide (TPR) repeat protein
MAKQKHPNKSNLTPAQAPKPNVQAPAKATTSNTEPATTGTPASKWFMAILAAVVLLVNVRTINYDYTLDDPFFTKDNPNVSQGLSAIKEFFTHAAYYGVFKHHDASYRPLMLTSFAAEKDLFGFNPNTGHLINLLLFALQVVVLFMLLRRIFRDMSPYIPFFITLLFALHPMHTEVIASIKSRDEIMGLLFAALTLLQTLKYIDSEKTKDMVMSGVWFFCALMSKETPIALVLIAPMTVYFFRDAPTGKIVRATLPYVAVAVVYLIMRSMFIESDGEKVRILVNNNALMAAGTYAEKLATLLFIQLKYLILLVFPHPLSYDYSYNQIPIIGFGSPKALAAVAVIAAMFVYALKQFRAKDVFAYCILFYGLSVVITSNLLVDIGATMAERFIFTGSLGYCMALVLVLAKVLKTDVRTMTFANARVLFLLIGGISVLYAGKTMARNEAWTDNLTLYKTGMETAQDSWRAQYLLGVEYTRSISKEPDPNAKKELYRNATECFNKSLAILPNNSDVYLLKGYADEFIGNADSAIVSYSNTLKLDSGNTQAAVNLGGVLLRKGRYDETIAILSRVLAKDSQNADALSNMGAAHGNKGLFKEAEQYYLRAVKIKPDQSPNVFMSMSNIYKYMGDSVNAPKYRALMHKAISEGRQ